MQKHDQPTSGPERPQVKVKAAKADLTTGKSSLLGTFRSLPPRAQALIAGAIIGLLLLFGLLFLPPGQTVAGMIAFGLALMAGVVLGSG